MNRSSEESTVPCDHEPAPSEPPIDPGLLEQAAEFFRAAGDTGRLRLLLELDRGERCVSDLAALTGEGLSTVSQRLKVLRAAGLVSRRRDHKHVVYSLADDHIVQLIRSAVDHARELGFGTSPSLTPNQRRQHDRALDPPSS